MVKIRLQRSGAKKRPYYRIVAAESTFAVDGRFIEVIGYYHPIEKNDILRIDEEKALKWLSQGAQPSETVKALFKEMGINQKFLAQKQAAKAEK